MTTNQTLMRSRSPSRVEEDEKRNKRYNFVLNPPRHTAGGLTSSWLVDQQTFRDGLGCTRKCSLNPKRQEDHTVDNHEALTQQPSNRQTDPEQVEFGYERGRPGRGGRSPSASIAPVPPRHINVHWAPFSADTNVTRATFHLWVQSVTALAGSSVPWAEATRTADDRIVLVIHSETQHKLRLDLGVDSGTTNPLFIRTTWLGVNLEASISGWPEMGVAPLIIAPIPSDIPATVVAWNIDGVGETPLFGPSSHFKKIAPGTWSFRLWSPTKRNQLLRHPLVRKWMARISTGTSDRNRRQNLADSVQQRPNTGHDRRHRLRAQAKNRPQRATCGSHLPIRRPNDRASRAEMATLLRHSGVGHRVQREETMGFLRP